MATYLVKTEPGDYSWNDLVRDKRTTWEGVRNNAALMHLRRIRKGDDILIYHTGSERRIAGLGTVLKGAYEDPADPGVNDKGEPKWAVIDIAPKTPATENVTLADIKADKRFADFDLVRQGRLSVMLVPPEIDKALRALARI
jgi:predicted RNA-binding protein with PUA-like domain